MTTDDRNALIRLAQTGRVSWDSLAHELSYYLSQAQETRDYREKLLKLAKTKRIAWDSLAHELIYYLSPRDFADLNRSTRWLDIEDEEDDE